jgi:hypothetical protein
VKPAAAGEAKFEDLQRANAIVAKMISRVDVNRRLGSGNEMNFDFLLVDGVAGPKRRSTAKSAKRGDERDKEERQTIHIRGARHNVSIVDGKCARAEVSPPP